MRGVVVEQHQPARAGLAGDVHGVVDRAMTPVALRLVFGGGVLRVVDEHVDAVAQLEDLVRDEVVGVLGMTARPVIRDVGHRDAVEVDAEAERRPDMAHPARAHLRLTDREVVLARAVEPHVACELAGRNREEGRPHHLREHVTQRGVELARPEHVEGRTLAMQRREEGEALDVIPVQVRQQRRAVELTVAATRVRAQAGTEVEDDRRRVVGLERDTRRLTTEPCVLRPGTRCRASNAVEHDAHPPGHGRGE